MDRQIIIRVLTALLAVGVIAGAGMAFGPSLDVVHEHDEHEYSPSAVYDDERDIVWSIDDNLEDAVTFVGYDVSTQEVIQREQFENGHGIAVHDDTVYIAEAGTLWAYNTSTEEFDEQFTLSEHPKQIEYDAERGWLWGAGGGAVWAHNVTTGEEVLRHEEHSDGISSFEVGSDIVASATTWDDEVIVYDIANDEVAFEPDLGYDDGETGIFSLHLNSENELFVGVDETIPVYDLDTQEQVAEYDGHVFGTLDILHMDDEGILATSGHDNTLKLQDTETGDVLALHEYEGSIRSLSLDRHNNFLWYGAGGGNEGKAVVRGVDIETADETDDTPAETDDGDGTPTDEEDSADDSPTDDGTTETPGETDGEDDDNGSAANPTDGTTDTNTDEDGLGFGVGSAFGGLGGIALLLKRRRTARDTDSE